MHPLTRKDLYPIVFICRIFILPMAKTQFTIVRIQHIVPMTWRIHPRLKYAWHIHLSCRNIFSGPDILSPKNPYTRRRSAGYD